MTKKANALLSDEDDFTHYFNATGRLSRENAALRAEVARLHALIAAGHTHEWVLLRYDHLIYATCDGCSVREWAIPAWFCRLAWPAPAEEVMR